MGNAATCCVAAGLISVQAACAAEPRASRGWQISSTAEIAHLTGTRTPENLPSEGVIAVAATQPTGRLLLIYCADSPTAVLTGPRPAIAPGPVTIAVGEAETMQSLRLTATAAADQELLTVRGGDVPPLAGIIGAARNPIALWLDGDVLRVQPDPHGRVARALASCGA